MKTYSTRAESVHENIVVPLEEHAADFDIEAIAAEVIGGYADGFSCMVEPEEFWRIVQRHDISEER